MSRDNYKIVRFGDMVHNINERILPEDADGLVYIGLEHLDPESLKIRRWGSPDDVGAQKLRFYAGDIIFGKRRYYQKKLAVADFDGICSAHAMVLRAKSKVVLPEFLPLFMQSEMFFERAMAISVGSLSPTINWSTLKKQEFPLPPLDEQRRIAEILWAVEETIQCHENTIWALEDLMNSTMEDYLMHGKHHSEFIETEIGNIPKTWKPCRIKDVVRFSGGSQPPRSTFVYEPQDGYIRLIQIRDYKTDEYLTYIPEERANKVCTIDDVMIGRYGPPIFQILRGIKGAYNVALMKAIPNEEVLLKDYLYYFLQQRPLFLPRLDLAKSLYRLSETQTSIQGASDHLVSEALYLADPDGVGIEIYRDRPRDEWTQTLDGVQMDILPLDLQGMLGELTPSDTQWQGLPAGTTIGHVHLHTGQNTDLSKRFYTKQLGLDVMLSLGGYWHFVAAGGYHHHIGLRPAGTRQNQASIGLHWYALDFPNALAREDAVAHLRSVGVDVTETDTGYHLYDHANNGIMLTHR